MEALKIIGFMLVCLICARLLLHAAYLLLVKPREDEVNDEGPYHTAQQQLCNQRKGIVITALGRPSKQMTAQEQQRYNELLAESDALMRNGLPKAQPAPSGKTARAR